MRRLDKLAVFRDPGDRPPVPLVPPVIYYTGSVMAFDQSLVHTGWVEVRFTADFFDIKRYGTLEGGSVSGFEASLGRAHKLYWELLDIMPRPLLLAEYVTLCEMPSVRGNRTDSALLGALAVRMSIPSSLPPPILVSRQRAATLLTGSPGAPKREIRKALRELYPRLSKLDKLGEHEADALAIAISWAHDFKEVGRGPK